MGSRVATWERKNVTLFIYLSYPVTPLSVSLALFVFVSYVPLLLYINCSALAEYIIGCGNIMGVFTATVSLATAVKCNHNFTHY